MYPKLSPTSVSEAPQARTSTSLPRPASTESRRLAGTLPADNPPRRNRISLHHEALTRSVQLGGNCSAVTKPSIQGTVALAIKTTPGQARRGTKPETPAGSVTQWRAIPNAPRSRGSPLSVLPLKEAHTEPSLPPGAMARRRGHRRSACAWRNSCRASFRMLCTDWVAMPIRCATRASE